jgi:general secretion pathway protein G
MIRKGKVQKDSSGFTLIEMLIVVIILGILAVIIIPQINVLSEEARLNTLKTNLKTVRKAIELYYHQHNNTYPGAVNMNGSGETPADANLPETFVYQLTRYTQLNGKTKGNKTALTPPIFGPYLKTTTLPENPYNNANTVTCDITVTDVTTRTAAPSDGTGWKFYVNTGVFIANDSVANAAY